jgi:competence protein ComEC
MRRLVLFTSFFAAGLFAAVYFLPERAVLPAAGVCAVLIFLFLFFKNNARKRVFIIFLALTLSLAYFECFRLVSASPAKSLAGEAENLRAVVLSPPSETDKFISCRIKLYPKDGKTAKAELYTHVSGLEIGDVIEISGTVSDAGGDSGTYRNYYYSNGVYLTVFTDNVVKTGEKSGSITLLPAKASNYVSDRIRDIFPRTTGDFAVSLITGDRYAFTADSQTAYNFSTTGLYHIIAVSGMHLTFLLALPMLFLRNKRRFALFAIPLTVFYMAFTGFTPSICRAGIMEITLMCSYLFRREADSLTSLFTALLVLLAINPYSIASVSLQLSFLSMLGLILLSQRIYNGIHVRLPEKLQSSRIVTYILSGMSASLSVTIFIVPAVAFYFGNISLISPLASFVVVTVLSVAYPLCIAACTAGIIYLPIGTVLAVPASFLLTAIMKTVTFFAGIPFASVTTESPYVLVWLVFVYLLGIICAAARVPAGHLKVPIGISAAFLIAVFALPAVAGNTGVTEVTFLDVGQGLCTVIEKGDLVTMVDCGSSSNGDAGETAVNFLRSRGKNTVDLLILTHYHDDHTNGLDYLLSALKVKTVAAPAPTVDDGSENIISLAKSHGLDIKYISEDTSAEMDGCKISIFAPLMGEGENERCLSVLVTQEDFDVLITGDMPEAGELMLIESTLLPDIEVLSVGHHGSATSTHELLLDAVTPEAAVISVGENSYGHPAEETLARLDARDISVFRTDIYGNITVSPQTE